MDIKRYNGKIYSIRSHQTDLIYIGSTCETRLSARLSKHKWNYKAYLKEGRYYTSFEILKYADAYIELIEEVKEKTKDELQRLEGEHIRNNNYCVNKNIAGRTRKERDEVNKDKLLAQQKEQKNKKYMCKCGKSLSTGNKSIHKKVCKGVKWTEI